MESETEVHLQSEQWETCTEGEKAGVGKREKREKKEKKI
jgi:hypothetical protein